MNARILEELYEVLEWPSSPLSTNGKRRMVESMELLLKVLRHEWLNRLLSKTRVKIVDVCSGGGVGGFALSKILIDMGIDVELVLIDVRPRALMEALRFRDEYMPMINLEALSLRAEDLHVVRERFDVAMLWGFSMPHFDPWKALRLFASIASVLSEEGVLLIEEVDRMLSIFLGPGYQYVYPEGFGNRALISMHRGYDIARGVVKRLLVDLVKGVAIPHEVHLNWTVALVASMLWLFFDDVDAIITDKSVGKAVILGWRPRAIEMRRFVEKRPRLLERGELVV